MDSETIRARIAAALPGAHVVVTDDANDGEHFSADVAWSGFAGLSRVAQHQAVYAALGTLMRAEIHALALRTRIPD